MAKQASDPLRRAAVKIGGSGRLPLAWYRGKNWGDALSPVLVSLLSGKPVVHIAPSGYQHDRYFAIGSILGGANERTEVWGTGFIRENERPIGPPRAVHAVRGPLSRLSLVSQGIECPEIYGDPALLLPRFFNVRVPQRYAVGIVPHYADKLSPWLDRFRNDPQVSILDIESGITEFVRSVQSCEVILSSSLHGLICADAYGVPNAWVQFSDRLLGGDFKFRDYRLSIGADVTDRVRVDEETRLGTVIAKAEQRPLRIDLRNLILACPFLSEDLREEVHQAEVSFNGLPEAFSSVQLEES